MAAPALVQSNGVATSVNSPASINAALSSASTKGNLLIMVVGVTGATPTVSTPANWTSIAQVGNASIDIAVFMFPNNPGGITTVAVTLTNATNGGAAASMFEFSGVNGVPTAEVLQFFTSNTQFPFTAPVTLPPQQLLELSLFTVAFQATVTLTNTRPGGDFSGNTAGATSTVATTNVTVANEFAINNGPDIPTQVGGSSTMGFDLSGVAQTAIFLVRLALGSGLTISRGAGGSTFIGQSLNPAGSLQTPQPIAPGNFFSGTTGSF